jgi:SAM-dependent methyltransferase
MSAPLSCPLCGALDPQVFISRRAVPVHQNALLSSPDAARGVTRGDLTLVVCDRCGFVHNQAFDSGRLSYGAEYDNAQTHSPAFRDYVDGLAGNLVDGAGVRSCRIVEVGCGDGYFLRRLVDDPAMGNTGVGFDPSYRGPDEDAGGRLRFERRFYDTDCAHVLADVVVCRHVIEHVPDPVAMLNTVRRALANSRHAKVYFETPCFEWIMAENAIWDLFYEHCSYFTASSLKAAFEAAGFTVARVDHVFGGQYLWLEATLEDDAAAPPHNAGSLPAAVAQFGDRETATLARLAGELGTMTGDRGIAIWGAGAKGVTLANLLDPQGDTFDCVIDINPNKQGGFIAGSGHRIVGLGEALARGVQVAVLTNPNYRPEIEAMVGSSGAALDLVDLT